MKRLLTGLLLLTGLGCAGSHERTLGAGVDLVDPETYEFAAVRPESPGYRLATGDIFDVDFVFERELDTRVVVRPDGRVALPLLGEVAVAGHTPGELDSLLTDAYGAYYRHPELTVNVQRFAPPAVYVLGEVRQPREVPLTPGMSLVQALAMAQPVATSNLSSVVLLRRLGEGKAYAQRINAARFLKGEADGWDVMLAPYDIVYVPATFVAKLDRFVRQFFAGIVPIPTLYLRTWEAFNTDEVYDTFLNRRIDVSPN